MRSLIVRLVSSPWSLYHFPFIFWAQRKSCVRPRLFILDNNAWNSVSSLNLRFRSSFNIGKLSSIYMIIVSSPLIPNFPYGTLIVCIMSALYLSFKITYLLPPVFSIIPFHSEVFFSLLNCPGYWFRIQQWLFSLLICVLIFLNSKIEFLLPNIWEIFHYLWISNFLIFCSSFFQFPLAVLFLMGATYSWLLASWLFSYHCQIP